MPPLLIDIGGVSPCQCDTVLEDLFKAIAEEPGGAGQGITWDRHANPWLADHVEDVTQRFQAILQTIQDLLARLLTGEPIGILAKALPPWLRWSEEQFEATRLRLESIPSSAYTLDDWLLVAEYLIHRYLPDGVIQTEADYLTVRAAILGKIQASYDGQPGATGQQYPAEQHISALVSLVPTDFRAVPPRILTPVETQILAIARARAADGISDIAAATRSTMKRIILEHVQAQVLGQAQGTAQALRQRLFDSFGVLNRDFRRIAVTEAGEACLQGYVAAQRPGQMVRRQEAYRGACPFCKSINGKVFRVVSPADPKRNGDTDIWLGKSNVGRSASPRKREGGVLVERPSAEMWWVAAGVMHPNCRGAWSTVVAKPPQVSQQYADWLDGLIAKAMRLPETAAQTT